MITENELNKSIHVKYRLKNTLILLFKIRQGSLSRYLKIEKYYKNNLNYLYQIHLCNNNAFTMYIDK